MGTKTRSVSQVQSYEQCPYAYYLERVEKVWQRPAAWFPMGTAVHAAIEAYEKSGRQLPADEAKAVFRSSYIDETNKYMEDTPNLKFWSWSGRYDGPADIKRRFEIGQTQVEKYYDYVAQTPDDVIWIAPDGTPGIEIEFLEDFDGIPMRGFIDTVKATAVEDAKTGTKVPTDPFQLKVYGMALKKRFGLVRRYGRYWLGKTGKASKLYDLDAVPDQEVYDRIRRVDTEINAGNFPATPGEHCRRCSVNTSCPFVQA